MVGGVGKQTVGQGEREGSDLAGAAQVAAPARVNRAVESDVCPAPGMSRRTGKSWIDTRLVNQRIEAAAQLDQIVRIGRRILRSQIQRFIDLF